MLKILCATCAVIATVSVASIAFAPSKHSIIIEKPTVSEITAFDSVEFSGVLLNYITYCRASVAPREHKFSLILGMMTEKYGAETVKDSASKFVQDQLQRGIFGTFCKRMTDVLNGV